MESQEVLIASRELRRIFGGITLQTVWRWVQNGTLPAPTKINGRNFWRASDVDALKQGKGARAAA